MSSRNVERLDDTARTELEEETHRHEGVLGAIVSIDHQACATEVERHLARVNEILMHHARRCRGFPIA